MAEKQREKGREITRGGTGGKSPSQTDSLPPSSRVYFPLLHDFSEISAHADKSRQQRALARSPVGRPLMDGRSGAQK